MMSDDIQFQMNYSTGLNKFQRARTKAFWQEMFDHLRGKPAELLSFENIRQRLRLREESYQGLQDVSLKQIVGSVGRYREFTRNYLPKESKSQERWSRVYAVANSQTGFLPIELYKVGDVYFVRDGNHRVSVARQIGAKTIEAHITELPTSAHLYPGMTENELDAAAAYAAFLDETGLARTRMHHQPMNLSEHTRYADLMGHIYLHKAIVEYLAEREVNLEEAAIHWYDTVYRPAVTLIRKYDMVQQVGVRTEADLYLWLVEYLRDLREQYGNEEPSNKISDALVDFLQTRKIKVPQALIEEDDTSMIVSRTQMMRAIKQFDKTNQNDTSTEDTNNT